MNGQVDHMLFLRSAGRLMSEGHATVFAALTDSRPNDASVPNVRPTAFRMRMMRGLANLFLQDHRGGVEALRDPEVGSAGGADLARDGGSNREPVCRKSNAPEGVASGVDARSEHQQSRTVA